MPRSRQTGRSASDRPSRAPAYTASHNSAGNGSPAGYRAIPEPDPGRTIPIDPEEINVIIVPGSVFDTRGGRLGYGGGYYDRFAAAESPRALRIAIAFEVQVLDQIPLLPHDVPMHILVTEQKVRVFSDTLEEKK